MLECRSQEEVEGTVQGDILVRLHSVLMNEISENTLNEELNKLLVVKNQSIKETQNMHCASHSESLNLIVNNY